MPAPGNTTSLEEHPACEDARVYLAGRSTEMIETLRTWADQNSGSDNVAGIERMAELVKEHALFLPGKFSPLTAPDSDTTCALRWEHMPRPGLPRVLLNGHLDTVFPADHPFQRCHIDDHGRIHGPGVADMKGGLVILFEALRAFLRSGLHDRLAWEVLVTFDEEVGSPTNFDHLKAAAQRNDVGLAFESSPHVDELIRNRMGTGVIDITCRGKAAHAGRNFADGRNAILALGNYLQHINKLNTSIPGGIVNVGAITGGGPVNVVPDSASASVNLRAIDPATQDEMMHELRAIASRISSETECTIDLSGGFTRPPKVAGPATEKLLRAVKRVGHTLDLDISWRDTGGASDGNILQHAGLPTIDNLGAVGTHLHSDAEFAECARFVPRAQLTACFLINLAAGRLDENGIAFVDQLGDPRAS